MPHRGVLLVNLGSPDSCKVSDVRKYLNEFLTDPHVIDLPWILRKLLLNCFILPFRPKKSAKAYQSIWTQEGSPLIVNSYKLAKELQKCTDFPIEIAMRYGNPSIESGLKKLITQNIDDILVLPLYPHYAMSSYKTVISKTNEVARELKLDIPLTFHPVFYKNELYIQALVASAKPLLQEHFDHLVFSFHGVPERHIKKDDPTAKYCLKHANCCIAETNKSHATCYKHQVIHTMHCFADSAGISRDKISLGFQSRLGKDKWLTPNTLDVLANLSKQGKKKILIICPSFVSDCLESLEEIGIAAKRYFKDDLGGDLKLIPCMNQHPSWIKALNSMINYRASTIHT